MKIALAQIKVIPGKPEKNVAKMLEFIEKAKKQKVDLIAFPEMCIGGYFLSDKWTDENYCEYLMRFNEKILQASKGIAICFGNVYVDKNEEINKRIGIEGYHPNKDGRVRKYNAAYIIQDGEYCGRTKETRILQKGVQPKTLLPNYRFFDDERYFFSVKDIAVDFDVKISELLQPFIINIKGKKIRVGLELCEDLWCEDYRLNNQAVNVSKTLIENSAEFIVNISSSPWTYGKNNARDKRVKFIAKDSGKFVKFFYVNCVGSQNNGKNILTFDGGSSIYNEKGNAIIFSEEAYKEELIIFDSDESYGEKVREEKEKIEQKYHAIVEGVKHLDEITGKENKYIIGLSGGIDSSVVTCLIVKALGKEKIIGVNMPARFNSARIKSAAKRLAENLKIRYIEIPIEEAFKKNQEILKKGLGISELNEVVLENIQAKIRATNILSNIAAQYNALFTCNGNKIEIATGYGTLYGDWGGAIAPIGDLTKQEVFEMGRFLNEKIFRREVISSELFPDVNYNFIIPPTAELKNNQIDPFKWGYHDKIIEQLFDYQKKGRKDLIDWYDKDILEEKLGIIKGLLERWGINNKREFIEDLDWLISKINNTVFKRVQSPPIIVLSKSAFGFDIRESIL